jgi:hypothetical protein
MVVVFTPFLMPDRIFLQIFWLRLRARICRAEALNRSVNFSAKPVSRNIVAKARLFTPDPVRPNLAG